MYDHPLKLSAPLHALLCCGHPNYSPFWSANSPSKDESQGGWWILLQSIDVLCASNCWWPIFFNSRKKGNRPFLLWLIVVKPTLLLSLVLHWKIKRCDTDTWVTAVWSQYLWKFKSLCCPVNDQLLLDHSSLNMGKKDQIRTNEQKRPHFIVPQIQFCISNMAVGEFMLCNFYPTEL